MIEGDYVLPIWMELYQDVSNGHPFTSFKEVSFNELWGSDVVVLTRKQHDKMSLEINAVKGSYGAIQDAIDY